MGFIRTIQESQGEMTEGNTLKEDIEFADKSDEDSLEGDLIKEIE